ncbi:Protein of unknown function DUF538 [Macleaya cordata]|uniref:DUF538 domain-containing protein n=1 Tax=Macleaya cordata TaxID=56857 RepID=A0A200R7Y5_MACCD|nr:Protein of unknown function DUF538 [Macleaya cordata]
MFFSSSICFFNLFLISLFFSVISVKDVGSDPAKNIYEVLKSHGLPIGLLPKGVTEFSLDENGRFEVHLDQACNAKFENIVHYDRNVSGTLSYGQIRALSGISAQELFLWFPVNGIRVDIPSSGLIYFDVGVIYKQFSLSLFETPPDCTAVGLVDPPDVIFSESDVISKIATKNLPRKLRQERDQENLQRAVQ